MASRGMDALSAIPVFSCIRNNGLRNFSGRCRWTVGIGLEAFALSRVPEPWWRTLHWSYLGAGAQGPQASVTSRTKQLEHSLFISWINLLSRVSKSYRESRGGVKGDPVVCGSIGSRVSEAMQAVPELRPPQRTCTGLLSTTPYGSQPGGPRLRGPVCSFWAMKADGWKLPFAYHSSKTTRLSGVRTE